MKNSGTSHGPSASELISKRIAELGDWRGETLSRMRKLIKEADPDIVEEWKWMGTPVWSHDGIICTGESYKKVVKLTFAKGASLKDPFPLFNSSLDGNARRAIDIHEGEEVTSPPSRRSFAKQLPSTVQASRNLRRKRSPKGFLSFPLSFAVDPTSKRVIIPCPCAPLNLSHLIEDQLSIFRKPLL